MNSALATRLSRLEEIAREVKKGDAKLRIGIDNCKIRIFSLTATGQDFILEAPTPFEAVEAVERHILKKSPNHVIMSYRFSDIFDLYPAWREQFAEYVPVICCNFSVGNYFESMENLLLKCLILYNHISTWGGDTMSNRAKGIIYKETELESLLPDEAALFEVLHDILVRETRWRENSGQFVPDTPHKTTGYMKFGRWAQ